jgi:branched-chain amino acid transport system substrate-binding protein
MGAMRKRAPRRLLGGVIAVACVMSLAACGDDDSGDDAAATTAGGATTAAGAATTAAGAATTAAGEEATGEPIVIGMYTPADNPSFTAPELIDGAEAAVEYVNSQLGGIGGRPIQLESCTTDYTAPGLTACANELFQKDPLIIIPGPDAGALSVQPTIDATGIPLIGGASFTPPEYASPNRALFNGWSASLFPAMVHFSISELQATNLVALALELPSNQFIKALFLDAPATAAGIPAPTAVYAPVGSADLTATFAAALDANPDALLAYGLPCQPAFQAYSSLGTDVPMIMPDNCGDPDTLAAAGDAANGVYFVGLYKGSELFPDDPEVVLYNEVMAEQKPDAADTDFSRGGFGTIMNIHELLDEMDPASLTHESVLAAFKATADQPSFLNVPYSCSAPPVPDLPGICAGSAYLFQFVDGTVAKVSDYVSMDELWGAAG